MDKIDKPVQFLSLVVFLAVAMVVSASAQTKSKPIKSETPWTAQSSRLIDLPNEIVEILPNGMVAIVKENHTAPVASVRLYVRAGSIYEQEYLGAGLSHIFEHLLAAGATKTRSEKETFELMQQIGASWNAYTTKDHTCYYLTVPAQHVGTALNLVADWVTRPTFPDDAFNREWGVVQREQEMGASDPRRKMHYLFDELRYKVHPSRYPVIGHQAVLQQVTRQEILDYYKRMYVPDNSVIVVVGAVNAEHMLQAIEKEFSDFTRRAKLNIVLPDEPELTAPREMVKVFPAMKGPTKMNIGFPSIKLQHSDLYALDTLAAIMGTGQSSRLYRSLREKQQLVISIGAYSSTPYWGEGTFVIHCELAPDKVRQTRDAVWREIEKIKKEGVASDELARAKRQLQVGHIRANQTAESQGATMARDYLATADSHFSDHYIENIKKVTAKEIRRMARKYLLAEKQITLILTPAPLAAEKSAVQTKSTRTPVKKIVLDNGLRILLKQNPEVPLVSMQLYTLGGLIEENDKTNGLTNLMTQLSLKGTASYTAEQIVDYFDGVGGSIAASAGNNTFYYTSEVMSEDFSKAFEIFSEIILKPTFPQKELAKLKDRTLAAISQVENSWSAQSQRFFRSKFFDKSPYRRISLGAPASVSAITPAQLRKSHKSSVLAERSILAIFGDIDPAAVESMARKYFAVMPKGTPLDLEKLQQQQTVKAPRRFVEKTAKNGATVYVGYPGMKLTNIQDRYPMEVLTEIIGSSSSTDWLFGKLRGAKLVYYAYGFSFTGVLPGYVAATAQCEADKVPDVLQMINDLLAKAAGGQFTDDEVALAKSSRINAEVLGKQTNAASAASAALDELYGLGYDWSKGYTDRIMAVSIEDVRNVAKKYLSAPPTTSIVTSKPEIFIQKKENKTSVKIQPPKVKKTVR